MISAIFGGHAVRESAFLDIDAATERIELFDGSLHLAPGPSPLHQRVSRRLANALDEGAEAADLEVFESVNVRLHPERIPVPDVVVVSSGIEVTAPVIDSTAVRLVCEILSPPSSSIDRVLKMHYYGEAGIEWYLLVDPASGILTLYQLAGSCYREQSTAGVGGELRLTEPVAAWIEPARLLG